MATAVAEKIIRIDVVASSNAQKTINALAQDMRKVESAATNMQSTMSKGFNSLSGIMTKLQGFVGSLGLTVGFAELTRLVLEAASAYQILELRFKAVLGSQERGKTATEEVIRIAKDTGKELDGVGKLYEKAARSAQAYGLSQASVKDITLGFSQALRLSGAGVQEAYAGLVQFGQALASGRLQGDEFRSIMENNSVFMYEFAKAAGVSIVELRKMSTEGKLTAKFLFETMTKGGEDGINMLQRLDRMAKQIPLTFGQSATSMKTAATELVGVFASLVEATTDDPLGVFGPLIRGLSKIADKLRELKTESEALKDGPFMNLLRGMAELPGGGFLGTGFLARLYLGNRDKPLQERIQDEAEKAKAALLKAQSDVSNALARQEEEQRRSNGGPSARGKIIAAGVQDALKELAAAEEAYAVIRKKQRDISYGERYVEAPKVPAVIDPEAARKQKTAMAALNEFAQAREREAKAQQALFSGQEDTKKSATDLAKLEELLTEAHVKGNSALATRIRMSIELTELYTKMNAAKAEAEKAETKRQEEHKTDLERLSNQVLRDTEAIDALKKKTRATDEYTEALAQQERAQAALKLETLEFSRGASSKDPEIQRLYELIAALDKVIATKKELMEVRADKKQTEDQAAVDLANARRIEQSADQINAALKKGLLEDGDGKSLGEQLLENLRDTLRNKTIDIIINPVTSMFSRVLAQIADQFSAMLTKSLFEMMANTSGDPIGAIISLIGSGSFGSPGGTGVPSTDYSLPTKGVRLAKGMDYVPYDDFPASLHRGERVLTAQENANYSRGGGVSIVSSPVIQIDSRTDSAAVYSMVTEAVQQGNKALVEEMRAQGVLP